MPFTWYLILALFLDHAWAICVSSNTPSAEQNNPTGRFFEPSGVTPCYAQKSLLNITWTTTYDNINLYLIEDGDFGRAGGILMNVAYNSYEWTVDSNADHSTLFEFRIVDATTGGGGFVSGGFYIHWEDDSPTSVTASQTRTGKPVSTQLNPSSATAAAMDHSPTADSSQDEEKDSDTRTLALGLGIGLGVPLVVAAGAALFFAWKRGNTAVFSPPAYTREVTNQKLVKSPVEMGGREEDEAQEFPGDSRPAGQRPEPHELW